MCAKQLSQAQTRYIVTQAANAAFGTTEPNISLLSILHVSKEARKTSRGV